VARQTGTDRHRRAARSTCGEPCRSGIEDRGSSIEDGETPERSSGLDPRTSAACCEPTARCAADAWGHDTAAGCEANAACGERTRAQADASPRDSTADCCEACAISGDFASAGCEACTHGNDFTGYACSAEDRGSDSAFQPEAQRTGPSRDEASRGGGCRGFACGDRTCVRTKVESACGERTCIRTKVESACGERTCVRIKVESAPGEPGAEDATGESSNVDSRTASGCARP
jgi:hypothetical protein